MASRKSKNESKRKVTAGVKGETYVPKAPRVKGDRDADAPKRVPPKWPKAYVPIERTPYVTGNRNPGAVAIDRVYGVEPDPRIPELITFLDDSTKPIFIRKTLHKSQGGYCMKSAELFNEDSGTCVERRLRKKGMKRLYKQKQHVPKRKYTKDLLVSADELMGRIIQRKLAMELASREAA